MPGFTSTPTTSPTPSTPNGSEPIIIERPGGPMGTQEVPVFVESGPRWLVQFLLEPPAWFELLLALLVLVSLAGAVIGYRRLGGLDEEVVAEQSFNVLVVFGVIIAMKLLKPLGYSYFIDVVLAFVLGSAAAWAISWALFPGREALSERLST